MCNNNSKLRVCAFITNINHRPQCKALLCIYPRLECEAKVLIHNRPAYVMSEEDRHDLMRKYFKEWEKEKSSRNVTAITRK